MSKSKNSKKRSAASARTKSAEVDVHAWLDAAKLRAEKCELTDAAEAYKTALQRAKANQDLRSAMEALSGLLRLAGERLDQNAIEHWGQELQELMLAHPRQIPLMAWYCKGMVSWYRYQLKEAQGYFLKTVRLAKAARDQESMAKAWVMLGSVVLDRGLIARAELILHGCLKRYEARNFRSVNGTVYFYLGRLALQKKDYALALKWYQKAHATYLAEHNWYLHLHVLCGYAAVARLTQNYSEAYWYIDMVLKAASSPEFGLLRRLANLEKSKLEENAIDLLVDSRKAIVQTREQGEISLGKQYVLLHILEALGSAHEKEGNDLERGLSKAEIIQKVWKENYRPEAHDNKLYYNINRLRKLIEPDAHNPQYLLNWKEGYRLAPGLRVRLVRASVQRKEKVSS